MPQRRTFVNYAVIWMLSDAVFQLQPVLLIVIAVQIVNDVLFRDVISRADVKMRDQVLLHQLPCGAVRDADHLTKLTDGHDVRIIAKCFFIISRHFQSLLLLEIRHCSSCFGG